PDQEDDQVSVVLMGHPAGLDACHGFLHVGLDSAAPHYWGVRLSNQEVSMRISELSQTSGVPTATIKYYLREGLLHEGELTSATQAQYDDSHLSRLALIRALVGAGGLSLAATRRVLDQLDRTDLGIHQLLGVTQDAILADEEPVDTTDAAEDRKSTRLNSSHVKISYAVFCL